MKQLAIVLSLLICVWTQVQAGENWPGKDQWTKAAGSWTVSGKERETPDGEWKAWSTQRKSGWILGGAVFEARSKNDEGSVLNSINYDPSLKAYVGGGVNSGGVRWTLHAGNWDGSTYQDYWTTHGNWEKADPRGAGSFGRCTVEYSSDFSSFSETCEYFSDGKWWTSYKGNGKKK